MPAEQSCSAQDSGLNLWVGRVKESAAEWYHGGQLPLHAAGERLGVTSLEPTTPTGVVSHGWDCSVFCKPVWSEPTEQQQPR